MKLDVFIILLEYTSNVRVSKTYTFGLNRPLSHQSIHGAKESQEPVHLGSKRNWARRKKKEKKEIISSQKESSIIFLYYSIFYDVSGNVCTSSIRRRLVLVLRHDQVENTREAVHTTQHVT